MEKRKLIQWLGRMEPGEREQFSEFLRSPLHSNRPQLASMMGLLITHYFGMEGADLENESFWALVYPEKPYNPNLLNRLLSEMTGELKAFLGLLQYKKDLGMQQIALLREYRGRRWEDVIPKEIKAAHKKLEVEIPHDEQFYHTKLELAVERIHYDSKNLGKDPGLIFQDCIEKLETYFVLRLLKFRMYSKHHDLLHRTQHMIRYEDHLWPEFSQNNLPPSEMVSMYWLIDLFQRDDRHIKYFDEYVQLLVDICPDYQRDQGPYKISKQECEDFFIAGISHCIERMNRGEFELGKYYRILASRGLQTGALLNTGQVKMQVFIQMVTPLIKLNEFQWATEFMDEYIHLVKEEERGFTILFLKATMDFIQDKYALAKRSLLQLKNMFSITTPTGLNMNSRQMLCRIFFEEEDYEAFLHEANSLLTFTRRNKFFSKHKKKPFQDFVRFSKKLERLIHAPPDRRKEKLIALKTDISNTTILIAKKWLINIIDKELGLTRI